MIYIPFLTLVLFLFTYEKRNGKKIDIVSYLFFVYILSSASSIIMYHSGLFVGVFDYSLEAMTYMALCFLIVFWGFSNFSKTKFNTIKINNAKTYKIFETVLIYGGLGAIIFFSPFAFQGLRGDVKINRMQIWEFQQTTLARFGIVNSFFSLFATFFILSLLFSFINYSLGVKYRKRANWLFLSSLSYIIYILAYVGRDGAVYWVMSFIFVYLLMKDFLSLRLQKVIRRTFLLIVIIILVPFFIITIARFGESDLGIAWEMVSYIGQQVGNFNDAYQVNAHLTYGQQTFPLFTEWLSKLGMLSLDETTIDLNKYHCLINGVPAWVFKTYIGSFLVDFGRWGTLLLLSISSIIGRNIIRNVNKKGSFSLSEIILFTLLYQNVLWGVFYFRFYSSNIYILAMVGLYLLFKLSGSEEFILQKKIK